MAALYRMSRHIRSPITPDAERSAGVCVPVIEACELLAIKANSSADGTFKPDNNCFIDKADSKQPPHKSLQIKFDKG